MTKGRGNILEISVGDAVVMWVFHTGQDQTTGMKQNASVFRWYHRVKNK